MTGSSPASAPTARSANPPDGPRVSEQGERVVLEFPASAAGPANRLVREAFTHPAVTADRPVLVCLPRGDSDVLAEVWPHLAGARTRVAGVTCLVEGRVRRHPAARRP